MGYKRIIEKKGESYGPYIYESYRDKGGNVKKRYLGKAKTENQNRKSIFIFVVSIIFIVTFLYLGVGYTTDFLLDREDNFFISSRNLVSDFISQITGFVIDEDLDNEVLSDEIVEEEIPDEEVEYEEELNETIEEVNESIEEISEEELNETIEEVNESIEEISEEEVNETILEETNQTEPLLNETTEEFKILNQIREIEIEKNDNYFLVLLDYFSGAEFFLIENIENISFEINVNNLLIVLDENFTGAREAEVFAFSDDKNLSQVFEIKVVENLSLNKSDLIIEVKRYDIIINRPARWHKKIISNESINLRLELPKEAVNISIKKGDEVKKFEEKTDEENKKIKEDKKVLITGQVSLDNLESRGFFSRIFEWFVKLRLVGKVVEDIKVYEEEDRKIIEIQENETEILVEYYTEAPVSVEENISRGKRIIISGPEGLNYTDILAYSVLENETESGKLKLYHIIEGARVLQNFSEFDLNENGLIDYVEWSVPHLSEQVYEIIYITKAEHLDENRSFIEDVSEFVKDKDDNWILITDGDYLRVTFERNLTSENDITIYARAKCDDFVLINGTEVPCEIYEKKMRIEEIRRGDE